MKKILLLLVFCMVCFTSYAQMPTDGNFTNWKWEDSSPANWKRLKDNTWSNIPSPFNSNIDRMNLIYEINKNKDYTYAKGWRLIHANFMGTFPYFILYNNGVLRGFIYLEGDAGIPYGNSVVMTVTPDSNLKTTKLLHLSENFQFAVNDKSAESLFSKTSVTATTTGGLNSWVALEVPMLFDNTVDKLSTNWTIEFFSGTNSSLSFNINGTSVPMDINGNNLFAHPERLNNGTSLKAEYASIHSNIKNLSEWGDKLTTQADKIDLTKNPPLFLKKYKDTAGKLGNSIKIGSVIAQVSGGLDVALGLFDFFFGSSGSGTIPLGYSHSFTGTGQITSLKYLRGNTMSVPGSSNAYLPSWSYNIPLGVMNLTNTPVVKRSSEYEHYPTAEKKLPLRSGYYLEKEGKIYSLYYYNYLPGGTGKSYKCYTATTKRVFIRQYKLWDNIDLNIKSGINIKEVKYALLGTENEENNVVKSSFSGFYYKYNYMSWDTRYCNFSVINPIYKNLTDGKYIIYDYNQTNKTFIYGTPYMTVSELKNVKFEALSTSKVSLGVIIKYTIGNDTQEHYFKGTYQLKFEDVDLGRQIYIADDVVSANFLQTSYPAQTRLNHFNYGNTLKSLGWLEEKASGEIHLYPNPSDGYIFFKGSENNQKYQVIVYDFSGRILYRKDKIMNGEALDLSGLPKGYYIADIKTKNYSKTEKIMIK